ncbi:hypothetical protein BYT27DRAFT_7229903 [Phlegmacium glaucopus]|nr:hypothetical protein BYT27DRAFT_7229903 [Phlegmacium glaucopus]
MYSTQYLQQLNAIRRKDPLREACTALNLVIPKTANLERLRGALLDYWYFIYTNLRSQHQIIDIIRRFSPKATISGSDDDTTTQATPHTLSLSTSTTTPSSTIDAIAMPHCTQDLAVNKDDEETLLNQYDVDGAAEEILGYDDDDEEEEEEEYYDRREDDDEGGKLLDEDSEFKAFQRRVRIDETQRAEGNRRAGGIKTQRAMVKAWEEFLERALKKGEIRDRIINEHHLLLYIKFCAERPKRTRKGHDIPGTFIGASHIKKLYFGALRIRKEQEADDPTLTRRRPATSVRVWDALKGRMNEALHRVRKKVFFFGGLIPEEDAPDIIANTFLAGITDEQMAAVGKGFLSHRELRSVINGHLCWTAQNASGNRGDDFRALKLSELQPYIFLHPNKETPVECILGLQGEEKAGAGRGMRTKINPVYTVFIAHLQPEMCPLGAFAFYHHYIHDMKDITGSVNIDWSINKSWRQVRILHGQKSPTTPYNEQSLYNLYVKAFASAGFVSGIKAHLPRHILGYRQEKLGVDSQHTSKLGWTRGETYFDTYAPSLPKEAILGAHGYKVHEVYDPVWRHVHVPEQFLKLVCPMAEQIHAEVVGKDNLSGTTNYWAMVISLRPYLFQCGAVIFQSCPNSALFKLPALANHDVQAWMKTDFPTNLSLLQAKAGNPVDFQRIQDEAMRLSLEDMRCLLTAQTLELRALHHKLERRTAVLSPTKSFSTEAYHRSYTNISDSTSSSTLQPSFVLAPSQSEPASHNESPSTTLAPQSTAQIDLVLPHAMAFSKPGAPQLFWPPILGQRSVTWDQVFALIERPEMLWECWRPSKSLDKYSLDELWECYNAGEKVFNSEGVQTGVKPPLRQVEQYFQSKWRKEGAARKAWERMREIPEFVESESATRGVSPWAVLNELESSCIGKDGKAKGLAALTKYVKNQRFEKVQLIGSLERIAVANLRRPQPNEPQQVRIEHRQGSGWVSLT